MNLLTRSKERSRAGQTLESHAALGSIASPSRSMGSGLFENRDEYNYHSKGVNNFDRSIEIKTPPREQPKPSDDEEKEFKIISTNQLLMNLSEAQDHFDGTEHDNWSPNK